MPKQRDTNIELLRCLLMFLIVLHHCCLFGAFKNLVIGGMSVSTHFAVNAFVFITGWYGVRFSWKKVLDLLVMGFFAVAILDVLSGLNGQGWWVPFSLGWFGNAYLALLFVSPLLNAGIDALRQMGNSALPKAWGAYAIFMLVNWLPVGDCLDMKVAGWIGHSFNTIVFVYVTGRVASMCEWIKALRLRTLVVAFVGLEMVNLFWAWGHTVRPDLAMFRGSGDYDAPFLVVLAAAVFLIFLQLPHKSFGLLKRAASAAGPSMFVVYLLHNGIPSPLPKHWIADLERTISSLLGSGSFGQTGATIFTAMGVFLACVMVDMIRRLIIRRF